MAGVDASGLKIGGINRTNPKVRRTVDPDVVVHHELNQPLAVDQCDLSTAPRLGKRLPCTMCKVRFGDQDALGGARDIQRRRKREQFVYVDRIRLRVDLYIGAVKAQRVQAYGASQRRAIGYWPDIPYGPMALMLIEAFLSLKGDVEVSTVWRSTERGRKTALPLPKKGATSVRCPCRPQRSWRSQQGTDSRQPTSVALSRRPMLVRSRASWARCCGAKDCIRRNCRGGARRWVPGSGRARGVCGAPRNPRSQSQKLAVRETVVLSWERIRLINSLRCRTVSGSDQAFSLLATIFS